MTEEPSDDEIENMKKYQYGKTYEYLTEKEKEIPMADDYDYGLNDPEYARQLALEKADGIGRLFKLKMHAIAST